MNWSFGLKKMWSYYHNWIQLQSMNSNVLLPLYRHNPHRREASHKALTLRSRWGLFLRKRMTSNSPGIPSRGKVKLLWKGTTLKSLCDKHAQAYFSGFDLLATVDLNERLFNTWLMKQLPSWYCGCSGVKLYRLCALMQIKYTVHAG